MELKGDQPKIKILYIITSLQAAGAEQFVVGLACNLDKSKFLARIVSTSNLLNDNSVKRLSDNGITLSYLDINPGFNPKKLFFVNRQLRLFKPDIVHTHLSGLFFSIPAFLLNKHILKVHTVHSIFERDVRFGMHFIYCLCFYLNVLPVAVSVLVRKSIRRFYRKGDIRVIPNRISVTEYQRPKISKSEWRRQEGFSGEDILLLCTARLSCPKNHSMLLDAFAKISAGNPRVHLVLAGEGKLKPLLKQKSGLLGISGSVHFLGSRTDIADILAATDIFALFSDYEGMSLSIMEAMAAGKPVVTTDVGGVSELIENGINGMLVPPRDINLLVKTINYLVANPKIMDAMGRAASDTAIKNFDIKNMVREYESLYLNL